MSPAAISTGEAWQSSDDDPNGKPALKKAATLGATVKVPSLVVSVPQNTYGAAMIIPVLVEAGDMMEWMHQNGEAYGRLVLNYVIQTCLLSQVRKIYLDFEDALALGPPQCEEQNMVLAISCIWLHVITTLKDMGETSDMFVLLWWELPLVKGPTQVMLYVEGENGSPEYVSGGFSLQRKILVTLFIILPKLAIAVVLLVFGGIYLAASATNADLLLNSLAVTFIMDIDEMIYGFLAPVRCRRVIESMPEFIETKDCTLSIVSKLKLYFGPLFRLLISLVALAVSFCFTKRCGQDNVFDGE